MYLLNLDILMVVLQNVFKWIPYISDRKLIGICSFALNAAEV